MRQRNTDTKKTTVLQLIMEAKAYEVVTCAKYILATDFQQQTLGFNHRERRFRHNTSLAT